MKVKRTLFALLALLVMGLSIALPVQVANAECSYSWEAEQPKGTSDGLKFIVNHTAEGCTYHSVGYLGMDPSQPLESERRWATKKCLEYGRADAVNVFKYKWGITIDPANVKPECIFLGG